MTEEETLIEQQALEFARANKKAIAKRLADPKIYLPEDEPVSVFMAGSPGAGKTEASIELLSEAAQLRSDLTAKVIRIDADELRAECPGYGGGNAWLFQKAASILVEKVHDLALEQRQSFVLDATFSNYDRACKNIERSLRKKRVVQILYVYQEPPLPGSSYKTERRRRGEGYRPSNSSISTSRPGMLSTALSESLAQT